MVYFRKLIKKRVFYLFLFLFLLSIFLLIYDIYLFKELKKQKQAFNKFKIESSDIHNKYSQLKTKLDEITKSYDALKNDYQNLFLDRENLASELKKRIEDSKSIADLEEKLREGSIRENAYLEELKSLREKDETNQKTIGQLTAIKNQLIKEKEDYKRALDEARDTSKISMLEEKIKSLQNVNNELNLAIKKAYSEIEKLKKQETPTLIKLKEEIKKYKENEAKLNSINSELKEKVKELNLRLTEAVNKNKKLEQKLASDPAKFAEIARQNKVLIKNTANMHYNLGVFYLKQKDYNRAVLEFEKAIELTPDDAYSHFNLGYIYAEYLVNRKKAIQHFKKYLQYAKADDKDIDWVKKYILTWQAYDAKEPIQ